MGPRDPKALKGLRGPRGLRSRIREVLLQGLCPRGPGSHEPVLKYLRPRSLGPQRSYIMAWA